MKKKLNNITCLIAFILFAITSCDKIEGPTRQEQTGTVDTTCTFDTDTTPTRKKVMIEEYTGFLCGNCPGGSVYLNDTLKPLYADSLVIISVHAGSFSDPCASGSCITDTTLPATAFTTDFRCDAGKAWFSKFSVSFYPVGIVDRIGYPSTMLSPKTQWVTKINNEFARAPEAKLRIQNTYDDATRKLRTCIETKFLNNMTDTFMLQVVLIEDSVLDWQEWYNHTPKYIQNYVHRHVLRTDVNGSFGTTIASGVITSGTTVVTGYNLTVDPAWNENHCSIVAFVYDAGNYRILQAEDAHVK